MFATTVIPHIKTAFQVGREEHDRFRYVGMDFATVEGGVEMQQDIYVKNLQPVLMDSSRALERDSPLTDCETDKLRSKIGQLLWVARQSRPDIMFDTCILASTLKHGSVQTMHEVS